MQTFIELAVPAAVTGAFGCIATIVASLITRRGRAAGRPGDTGDTDK